MNGFPGSGLAIQPGRIELRLSSYLTRLLHPALYNHLLIHAGPDVRLTKVRFDLPWRRMALLLYKAALPTMIQLPEAKGRKIWQDLSLTGFEVDVVSVKSFGSAVGMLRVMHAQYRDRHLD